MYNVVFRNTTGGQYSDGAITWSTFQSKEDFNNWYDAKLKSWYQVVEQGVTQERALELCSTPEEDEVIRGILCREVNKALEQLGEELARAELSKS